MIWLSQIRSESNAQQAMRWHMDQRMQGRCILSSHVDLRRLVGTRLSARAWVKSMGLMERASSVFCGKAQSDFLTRWAVT